MLCLEKVKTPSVLTFGHQFQGEPVQRRILYPGSFQHFSTMSKQKRLITSGAGYIGIHVAELFNESCKKGVLLGSLYQGIESRVGYLHGKHAVDVPLEVIDLRDYVKIQGLISAGGFTGIVHTVADATMALLPTMKIGTGKGASVREIVKSVFDAIGRNDVTPIDTDRRAGNPAFVCANVDLAATEMGFKSNYSLGQSIRSLF